MSRSLLGLSIFSFVIVSVSLERLASFTRSSLRLQSSLTGDDNMVALLRFVESKLEEGDFGPFKTTNAHNLIGIEMGGVTNYCCKCFDMENEDTAVFVKHSFDGMKGMQNSPLSAKRLRNEYAGMLSFSKYAPNITPRIIHFDEQRNYLVLEFLADYIPLAEYLQSNGFDLEIPRYMGTAMGRNHARTHRALLTEDMIVRYSTEFANAEHFDFWNSSFFPPALHILDKYCKSQRQMGQGDESRQTQTESSSYVEEVMSGWRGIKEVFEGVHSLQQLYLEKKEALVHGDLHFNNVLLSKAVGSGADEEDARSAFKVVDFEKSAFGPAGLDLGIFLANLVWYYAAHSDPQIRRSISSAMLASIEAYKSAFRVQMVGALNSRSKSAMPIDANLDAILNEILLDAMGFMGLYPLFLLTVIPNVDLLSVAGVPELHWGDTAGRLQSVRRRQLRMSLHAITKFHAHHKRRQTQAAAGDDSIGEEVEIPTLGAKDFADVLQTDDHQLNIDHMTEFWF